MTEEDWLQNSDVFSLFPTLVWKIQLPTEVVATQNPVIINLLKKINPPVTQLTGQNTDQVVLDVTDGTLLLFPSYILHSVDANDSNELRISISFSLMFSQFVEKLSKPLWEPSPSDT